MPATCKIDAISRAVIDATFGYSFADRFHVAWISEQETTNSGQYACPSRGVPQPREPACVGLSLANFDHCLMYPIGYKMQACYPPNWTVSALPIITDSHHDCVSRFRAR